MLKAIHSLGENAYGCGLQEESRIWSLGTMYLMGDRLELNGYVNSSREPGGPERNYTSKRVFELTEKGRQAIQNR